MLTSNQSMHSSNQDLILQAISSRIGDRTDTEIFNESGSPYPIKELIDMLNKDTTVYSCCQLKTARVVELAGVYQNKDKRIEDWINKNINNFEGSLSDLYSAASTAIPLGMSVQEILFDSSGISPKKEWRLKGFNVLNPAESQISFKVTNGKESHLLLQETDRKVSIPMWKIFHITSGSIGSFGRRKLFGFPELSRVAVFVKLKQYIYSQMAVAARTRATGVVVGRTHTNVRVPEVALNKKGDLSPTGKTITAAQNLFNNIKDIQNFSVLVTDKNEEIESLSLPTGDLFYRTALELCKDEINRGLLVPGLLLDRPAASYSLSDNQLTMFDSNIKQIVTQVEEKLLERVWKPLIIWNFGRQEQYGEYVSKSPSSTQLDAQRIQEIYQAMAQGVLTPDLEIKNLIRKHLSLSPTFLDEPLTTAIRS